MKKLLVCFCIICSCTPKVNNKKIEEVISASANDEFFTKNFSIDKLDITIDSIVEVSMDSIILASYMDMAAVHRLKAIHDYPGSIEKLQEAQESIHNDPKMQNIKLLKYHYKPEEKGMLVYTKIKTILTLSDNRKHNLLLEPVLYRLDNKYNIIYSNLPNCYSYN